MEKKSSSLSIYFFILLGLIAAPIVEAKETYTRGGKGPGGGIVFNVDNSGVHGLEAQPADYTRQPGDLQFRDGDGPYYTWSHAVAAASSYGSGWRLPTKDELLLLYLQKSVVGGFVDDYYWSSSESGSGDAWTQRFGDGDQYDYIKRHPLRIRAVRAF